jgi:hypothetical protein
MAERISDEEALRRLREFVSDLRGLLLALVEYPGPVIPGRHQQAMHDAWASVHPKFDDLRKQLQETSGTLISDLAKAGLTGHELVFKLSIFNHARDQLLDALASTGAPRYGSPQTQMASPTIVVPVKEDGWWKRRLRPLAALFKRALGSADVILGSIATALPLSPAEAIKEYKEAAESGVDLGSGIADVIEPPKNDAGLDD